MTPEQLDGFVDPQSGAVLRPSDLRIEGGQVREGSLRDESGRVSYPVVDFVPRFVPAANYAGNFGLQWQRHRRTQLDSCNGASYSRDRLLTATGWPARMPGERILEAGSGAGRFTEVLLGTGALVHSFDFSDAVVANRDNNGQHPNLVLFQGDIYRLPLPPGSFDRVVCLGVIQHTPDPARAFQCLARMVKPGGSLVVDAYSTSWKQVLHWKYALRPLVARMDRERLYRLVAWYAPRLMPAARLMRRLAGRAGARLVPILDQSDKAVPPETRRDWTILDTYDALSPAYDHPQSASTLRRWFEEGGFTDVTVNAGAIGLDARGRLRT
jgi:SAM-dependent methyltransferase